jgi:hypothetical protein
MHMAKAVEDIIAVDVTQAVVVCLQRCGGGITYGSNRRSVKVERGHHKSEPREGEGAEAHAAGGAAAAAGGREAIVAESDGTATRGERDGGEGTAT